MAKTGGAVEERDLWKNHVDPRLVKKIGSTIGAVWPRFDQQRFVAAATAAGFQELELKARIERVARSLGETLPDDYHRATEILVKVSPQLRGFANWVVTKYVELYGLEQFERSLEILAELTKDGSSEFAIRPFVIMHPERTLRVMSRWARDDNEHVRRLAAEGSRPRGVWVAHVEKFRHDPTPVVKLLEQLNDDPSAYVRRAVANNLNDIAKDHPEIAVATAARWWKKDSPGTKWVVRHGLRGLVKKGNQDALKLLEFTSGPQIEISNFKVTPKSVRIGGEVGITLGLKSKTDNPQKLVIDFRVHYVKKTARVSVKTFKWSTVALGRESMRMQTKLVLKDLSTRKHYPGRHRLELLINGLVCEAAEFDLRP